MSEPVPQPFLVIQPVPHHLYADPPMMWEVLDFIWTAKLADDGGVRVQGPLNIREMKLAEIVGSTLADYLFSDDGTAAVYRIVGPALPPEAFIGMMPLWKS